MHNATSAVIAEIEIIFGKIPENDISLSEETIIVGDWNLHQEGIDSENE
jgi:hypothetical protein